MIYVGIRSLDDKSIFKIDAKIENKADLEEIRGYIHQDFKYKIDTLLICFDVGKHRSDHAPLLKA
jgi:hypothetical protein